MVGVGRALFAIGRLKPIYVNGFMKPFNTVGRELFAFERLQRKVDDGMPTQEERLLTLEQAQN
jgi:hypothetical protein